MLNNFYIQNYVHHNHCAVQSTPKAQRIKFHLIISRESIEIRAEGRTRAT